jgi:hypothetical protein
VLVSIWVALIVVGARRVPPASSSAPGPWTPAGYPSTTPAMASSPR